MQGRLVGKRVTGDFFVDHAQQGTHFCTYLLGTDMEMSTPAGYRLMNWETGYGDYLAAPDGNTQRVIPCSRSPRSCWPMCATAPMAS